VPLMSPTAVDRKSHYTVIIKYRNKGIGKLVPVLFLTEYYEMRAYWGVEVQFHAFLTSALEGGEWSASRPGRFIPVERAPVTIR
jgi:hypothetical protein